MPRETYFARFDIVDFFGRVNRNRIARNLKGYFGAEKAHTMAQDSTVRHPENKHRWVLPYGFVQSPILTSLSLAKSRIGTQLARLQGMKGFEVGAYVDVPRSFRTLRRAGRTETLTCDLKLLEQLFRWLMS